MGRFSYSLLAAAFGIVFACAAYGDHEQGGTMNQNEYAQSGRGGTPTVLFLHSAAGNADMWHSQLSHLEASHRVLALDYRGHGSAVDAEGPYTLTALVDDIHHIVEDQELAPVVLVGHSMGGLVALEYARRFPDLVDGLLLLDPAGDSTSLPEEQVRQILGTLDSDAYASFIEGYYRQLLAGATETTSEAVLDSLSQTPRQVVVSLMRDLFSYDPGPALDAYRGPRLSVITAVNEVPWALHNLVEDLPSDKVSDTGHWLHMDRPDEINRVLDTFLESVGN